MSEYEPVWQTARRHKALTATGIILAGLIGTGAVAGMCSDLDPSGQARKGNEDHNVPPENTSDSDETIMHNGVEILLTINS